MLLNIIRRRCGDISSGTHTYPWHSWTPARWALTRNPSLPFVIFSFALGRIFMSSSPSRNWDVPPLSSSKSVRHVWSFCFFGKHDPPIGTLDRTGGYPVSILPPWPPRVQSVVLSVSWSPRPRDERMSYCRAGVGEGRFLDCG